MESSLSTRGTGTTRSDWCGALNKLRRPDFLPPMCLVGALHCKSVLILRAKSSNLFCAPQTFHALRARAFYPSYFSHHRNKVLSPTHGRCPQGGFLFFFQCQTVCVEISQLNPSSHCGMARPLRHGVPPGCPTLPLQMVEPECVGESQ